MSTRAEPSQGEIAGTWKVVVHNAEDGKDTVSILALSQEQDKLTGTYTGHFGRIDVAGLRTDNRVRLEGDAEGRHVRIEGVLGDDGRLTGSVEISEDGGDGDAEVVWRGHAMSRNALE